MIIANWRWTKDIETKILDEIKGLYPIVHVCSGDSSIGDIRIDRWFNPNNPKVSVKADMCSLPLKNACAAAVITDPPYDEKRHSKSYPLLINECVRILKPSGKLIFLHRWIPQASVLYPKRIFLRPAGIAKGAYPTYKILSISIKINGQISDYTNLPDKEAQQ